jgi:tetratricopeptide (TPR) repeat protein
MLTVFAVVLSVVLHGVQQQTGSSNAARQAVNEAAEALDHKDNAKALASADRAIALAPGDQYAHLLRCRSLAGLRRHEEAVQACSESLRLKPNSAEALRDRGHYYLNLGRIELGLADLERAASMTKDDRGVYYHLGLAHYLRGDFAAAATAYQGCLRHSTDEGARTECRAWLYPSLLRAGREAEARGLLRDITSASLPGHPGNYQDRLLLFSGARTEAQVAATMSAEGALSETTVGYTLGLWHLLQGRSQQARAYFQRVLDTGYTTSWGYRAAASEMQRLTAPRR